MAEPARIRTRAQFRNFLRDRGFLVITDSADGATFHADPAECSGVDENHFATKVLENGERHGSYLIVASLDEARASFPGLNECGRCGPDAVGGEELADALAAATGVPTRPRAEEPSGVESIVDGWRMCQRVALGRVEGSLVLRAWPGELKDQALSVYGTGVGAAIVALAEGPTRWTGRPKPHLAFTTSKPGERFYFHCPMSLAEYVAGWSCDEDLAAVRQYEPAEVEASLWPWLCERGYARADDRDDREGLARFVETLRRRRLPPLLRPSIELEWVCDATRAGLADEVREAVAILARALGERLPDA